MISVPLSVRQIGVHSSSSRALSVGQPGAELEVARKAIDEFTAYRHAVEIADLKEQRLRGLEILIEDVVGGAVTVVRPRKANSPTLKFTVILASSFEDEPT